LSSQQSKAVFLFDVDNTLLDNDRVIEDVADHIDATFGAQTRERYFEIFEQLRREIGYADYLGALQRYRDQHPTDVRLLALSSFLLDYPFADRLYPGALQVLARCGEHGLPVILSDGDVVFQPHKVHRSGIHAAVDGRVLIYIHKEQDLDDVERRFPAERYVLIDDKPRVVSAVKAVWGDRVTTILPRQGHYANDPASMQKYPPADVTVNSIGDLLAADFAGLGL
jgi:beta-phosphoglucomutase-like phosphatase (HAD superfamily)